MMGCGGFQPPHPIFVWWRTERTDSETGPQWFLFFPKNLSLLRCWRAVLAPFSGTEKKRWDRGDAAAEQGGRVAEAWKTARNPTPARVCGHTGGCCGPRKML